MAKQEKVFSFISPHKHLKAILRKYNLHMYLKSNVLYIYITTFTKAHTVSQQKNYTTALKY